MAYVAVVVAGGWVSGLDWKTKFCAAAVRAWVMGQNVRLVLNLVPVADKEADYCWCGVIMMCCSEVVDNTFVADAELM